MSNLFTNTAQLNYRYDGPSEGPVLVLINALGTELSLWNGLVSEIQCHLPTVRLLRYDLRGQGKSPTPAPPYTIEDHTADLMALLDKLGIKEAVFCGLSIGGLIAQCITKNHVSRVKGLVLIGTAAKIGSEQSWDTRIEQVNEAGLVSLSDNIMKVWFSRQFHQQHPEKVADTKKQLERTSKTGYLGSCEALKTADYRGSLEGIRLPTMCVVGQEDGSTPPDVVKELAASLCGAQMHTLDDAAHMLPVEKPQQLARMLAAFYDEYALL
ncbi:3-oxoadipate enol-lactonase [Pokkaliibacter sp. CJK22405]|uniref:3-oxoadipate enol-lactonase n=1 Tax=Pokkaliibacter sp. CJK22405 TaxID=3384615 RepID=UPI0039849D00